MSGNGKNFSLIRWLIFRIPYIYYAMVLVVQLVLAV
jgi:hypothetical protein